MARPLKTEIDYFSHDTGMSSDEKIEHVEHKFGNDGYAIYCKILEKVFRSEGKFNITTEEEIEIYSSKWHVTSEKLKNILEFFRKIKLFPEKNFISNGVKKRISLVNKERKRNRKRYNNKDVTDKGFKAVKLRENCGNTSVRMHKVKESKVKESKVKYIEKENTIPPEFDWIKIRCEEMNYPDIQQESEKFFNYYSANGWRVGKNPMKNWQSALANWFKNYKIFNHGSKIPNETKRERLDRNIESVKNLIQNVIADG